MNPLFLTLLQLHRSKMTVAERRRNANPHIPKIPYPIATEEVYAESIGQIQQEFAAQVREVLDRRLAFVMNDGSGMYKHDSVEDDFEKLQEELHEKLLAIFGATYLASPRMQTMLNNVSNKVRNFIEAGFARQVEAVAGVAYNPGVPDWPAIRGAWEQTNYSLIKNLSEEFISKINSTILTGIQANWTIDEMAAALQKVSDKITGWRSQLIARDQIGKLNNKITKSLHTNMGMTEYLWSTSRDERVRGNPKGRYPKAIPSHYAMEGVVCSWADSTIYTDDAGRTWKKRTGIMSQTEPGMESLCRCTAQGMFITAIRAVDLKLNGGI